MKAKPFYSYLFLSNQMKGIKDNIIFIQSILQFPIQLQRLLFNKFSDIVDSTTRKTKMSFKGNNKNAIQKHSIYASKFTHQISPQSNGKTLSMTKRQFLVPLINPYLKKFNVRRLTHTEQARKKSQQKQELGVNLRNSANTKNQKGNGSIDIKKVTKLSNIRMHTQKLVNSPYRLIKQHIHTQDPSLQNSFQKQQDNEKLKQNYLFFTSFERQQAQRYQILYAGKRRVHSVRDFTDVNGDAKVYAGDQIAYRYEVKNLLGKGSFGQVFKAYDHKKKQHIAIKIIRNHPKFTAQAKIQIKILQQVVIKDSKFKSNIVQLKHGFFFRGHPCLVFQLLHLNLYEFIKSYNFVGLNIQIIRRIAIQILQGLQFFKKYDIIHCDLKPQNILLKQQNKTGIKIIDVGSGCYRTQQIYTYIQSRFYRAPQIIIGMAYTTAIDIWSFGCILCELFTGYPIFPGQSQHEQMLMFMQILGKPSNAIVQQGNRSHKFFNGAQPIIKPNGRGRVRKPGTKTLTRVLGTDDDKFLSMVQLCLKWDPQQRISPSEALLHPWIIQGLPQEIRKQHINQVYKDSKIQVF